MHECNAMQLLETKEKKKTQKPRNKEQWSQRKSNEAQGPRKKKRQIRDTKSHQLLDEESQTYFYQEVW